MRRWGRNDLIEETVALWESLAMNHGFVDGNERVAYACLEMFLQSNGADVIATNDELEAFIYGNLVAGPFRKEVLERWLREHVEPFDPSAYS